jgi:hypothetical protein
LTKTLDSISEIEELDFLEIDVRGEGLRVFKMVKKKLASAVVIQIEFFFIPRTKASQCLVL